MGRVEVSCCCVWMGDLGGDCSSRSSGTAGPKRELQGFPNLPNHRSFFRSAKRTSVFDTQRPSSTWSNLMMILKCNADLPERVNES